MRKLRNNHFGFSLLELLVALSLMIIIVGATVTIFMGASKILGETEEKMFVFQNARAGIDTLSKDLKNAQDDDQFFLTINNPQNGTSPQLLMKFLTTTSWIDSNDQDGNIITGEVRVYYYLEERNDKWNLKRHIVASTQQDGTAVPEPDPINVPYAHTKTNDIVCQFVHESLTTTRPVFATDYFFFNNENPQKLLVVRPNGTFVFDGQDDLPEKKFPFAMRISMDLTDDSNSTIRTFSKTVRLLPSED